MLKMALVDVETTGGYPQEDRIIDIGIVLVDEGQVTAKWESLVNPEIPINPFITGLTGIADSDVYDAPAFSDIYETVDELLADRIFVAHNVRFDYGFIRHEFLRLNRRFSRPQLCTVRLSKTLFPTERHHNLDAIINRFQIPVTNRHRALPDAEAMYAFLESCRQLKGDTFLTDTVNRLIKTPSLPKHIQAKELESLPNTHGVYIFYDHSNSPLYIGKSIHIKDRVFEHFYQDMVSMKELRLKESATHIDTVPCAGELESLLTESRLIKQHLPVFNVKLRDRKGLWILSATPTETGYLKLTAGFTTSISYEDKNHLFGIFATKRQLTERLKEACQTYHLCPKLCGLEQGTGACFAYHLEACSGACIGKEPIDEYNHRLAEALSAYRIQDWPFPEPLIIHERDSISEIEAFHLVVNWSVVATTRLPADILETSAKTDVSLSLDEYKIIKQFVLHPESHDCHLYYLSQFRAQVEA